MPVGYILVQLGLTDGSVQMKRFADGVRKINDYAECSRVSEITPTFGGYDFVLKMEGGSAETMYNTVKMVEKIDGFLKHNFILENELVLRPAGEGRKYKAAGDPI